MKLIEELEKIEINKIPYDSFDEETRLCKFYIEKDVETEYIKN